MKNRNTIIAVAIIVVLAAAGGWYYYSSSKQMSPAGQASTATVATVNGESISKSDLTAAEAQITSQQNVGTSTEAQAQVQTQALDSLIGEKLLAQAAKQAGIVASSTVVAAQLQAEKAQFQDDATYQKALATQGMTEADLQAEISSNVLINEYLEQTLKLSAVTASDAEIQAAYDKAIVGQTNVPPLTQVRDQVKQLVLQQKQQALALAQVQKLRAAADVKILIQ